MKVKNMVDLANRGLTQGRKISFRIKIERPQETMIDATRIDAKLYIGGYLYGQFNRTITGEIPESVDLEDDAMAELVANVLIHHLR